MAEVDQIYWLACGEEEPDPSDHWLSDLDRSRISRMVYRKRHDEARLSRWTAQRAVAMLSGTEDISTVSITNAPDGSPRAVTGDGRPVPISSTDRAGWAVTAVTDADMPIGCDLELVEPRSDLFIRDYLTPTEQEFVATGGLGADLAANLIWSAKESALKVLRTGLREDTRSVEVQVESAEAEWSPLKITSVRGVFPGWWRRFGGFLLTIAASRPTSEPISLVEPTPLATAEPAHSWLADPLR